MLGAGHLHIQGVEIPSLVEDHDRFRFKLPLERRAMRPSQLLVLHLI